MEKTMLNADNLTGPQKAAILLLSMGEEYTSSCFKELNEDGIKKIGKTISEITFIASDVLNKVLDEFLATVENDVNLVVSGKDFLRDVVNKSLEKETAREVFRCIDNRSSAAPFSSLEQIPAESLYNLIKSEHPQTVALILSHMPQKKAAELLRFFPRDLKADISYRILQTDQVDTAFVTEIDETIKKEILKIGASGKRFDGVEKLANILNDMDADSEEAVLSHIENEDRELADRIRQKMFVFEDLLNVDNRHFREILQNIDNQILAKALRTATDDMKQKIFGNLSQRASDMLKEDMEVMGPLKLSDVEEAQQDILTTAKRLEAEGRIVLGKGKDDVFV